MFDKLIGQEAIKRKLEFYTQAHKKTSTTPFLLLVGAKGLGKTHFAREFSRNLMRSDGQTRKPFMEINCSGITTLKQFLETLYVPVIMGNEMTILFDECHMLPKKLEAAFLTVLNTEKGTLRTLRTEQGEYPFDFKQLTFLFATTEPDQVFAPLKDRLKRVDFAEYSEPELGEILKLNLEDVEINPQTLEEISSTLRGNARSAVSMAEDIDKWCEINHTTNFDGQGWKDIKETLDIKPLGLTQSEVQILRLLRERGPQSLQMLSAATGFSRSAIQRETENYLLARGLMDIEGQRRITEKGREILASI